jgi:hypothetical protein
MEGKGGQAGDAGPHPTSPEERVLHHGSPRGSRPTIDARAALTDAPPG